MANEGESPKVDGDVHWASEINNSRNRVYVLDSGNSTAFPAGSTVYGLIEFGNDKPDFLRISKIGNFAT